MAVSRSHETDFRGISVPGILSLDRNRVRQPNLCLNGDVRPETQVRTRLAAGGSRIRTLGPPPRG